MTLFRQEAIDHQRRRLWGEVVLTQRMSYRAITELVLCIVTALGLLAINRT